jgi:hypothetical protein
MRNRVNKTTGDEDDMSLMIKYLKQRRTKGQNELLIIKR